MSFLLNLDSSTANNIKQTDDFTVLFGDALNLSGDWEVALIKSNLYYSWYNISAEKNNNATRYFNGSIYQNITFPDGQYSVDQIDSYVKSVMKANGDFSLIGSTEIYDINIEPNYATGKIRIEVSNSYTIDLQLSDLNLLLGFDKIEVTTTQEGTNLANINDSINSLLIRCDVIEPSASYNNAISSDVLYSFVPDSIPQTNINVEPRLPIYVPIYATGNRLKRIRLYLTDNLLRRVNLNGEPFSALLHFKKVK